MYIITTERKPEARKPRQTIPLFQIENQKETNTKDETTLTMMRRTATVTEKSVSGIGSYRKVF